MDQGVVSVINTSVGTGPDEKVHTANVAIQLDAIMRKAPLRRQKTSWHSAHTCYADAFIFCRIL
jgi:hypothetical protein